MKFTSDSILLAVRTTGSGKSGFFARGEVAQEKIYTVEHVPSSPGGAGADFPTFPTFPTSPCSGWDFVEFADIDP